MTKQEKVIVSAYTGKLMCDFGDAHEYIEKKLGRPVYTHELADKNIWKEIEEKSKEDFLDICKQEEPERKTGHWIDSRTDIVCSICSGVFDGEIVYMCKDGRLKYCPNCGAKMTEE